jgi:hypothetical protein
MPVDPRCTSCTHLPYLLSWWRVSLMDARIEPLIPLFLTIFPAFSIQNPEYILHISAFVKAGKCSTRQQRQAFTKATGCKSCQKRSRRWMNEHTSLHSSTTDHVKEELGRLPESNSISASIATELRTGCSGRSKLRIHSPATAKPRTICM